MEPTPVTHAWSIGPLPDLLEARAGQKAVEAVFAEVGLPHALLRDRRQCLPMPMLAQLYQKAAWRAGDPLFGHAVGAAMPPDDYGMWARYAAQAPTLREGIHRAIRTLPLHETGTRMRLRCREGARVAWEYWHPQIGTPLFRQHSDQLARVMIAFLQGFLGSDWMPTGVEFAYGAAQSAKDPEAYRQCVVTFDQPGVAIVLPRCALDTPNPQVNVQPHASALLGYADVVAVTELEVVRSPLTHVAAVISLRLLDGQYDIDGAARTLGLTSRTLQRRLEEHGLSYRALLSRMRMRRAKSMILETNSPLKDICFELGYSDPAHFTRAFTRHFGFPPSRLRPTLNQGN